MVPFWGGYLAGVLSAWGILVLIGVLLYAQQKGIE